MKDLGLENFIHDPCLYTWRKEGQVVAILLYVDDILTMSNNVEKLKVVKTRLSQVFEMKDLGEPDNFLGMKIS